MSDLKITITDKVSITLRLQGGTRLGKRSGEEGRIKNVLFRVFLSKPGITSEHHGIVRMPDLEGTVDAISIVSADAAVQKLFYWAFPGKDIGEAEKWVCANKPIIRKKIETLWKQHAPTVK